MTKPSWQDYGTYDESEHAWAWSDIIGLWAPCLGPTGGRIHDISLYGNWGGLVNVTPENLWVIDEGQYCTQLSRTLLQSVSVQNYRHPTGNFDFTISMWIKWTALDANFAIPFMLGSDMVGGNRGYFIWRENASSRVRAEFGSNTGVANATSTTPNNVWTHAVGTYNRATNRIFLNGKLEGTVNYTAANISGSFLSFGAAGNNYQTNCRIAEIVVWRKSLTPNEISSLYNLGRGGILQRRRRTLRRTGMPSEPTFRAAWARQRAGLIGGGVR